MSRLWCDVIGGPIGDASGKAHIPNEASDDQRRRRIYDSACSRWLQAWALALSALLTADDVGRAH